MKKKKLYIDTQPLLDVRMSGIGQVTLQTIKAILDSPTIQAAYEVHLVVPYWKRLRLAGYELRGFYKVRYIYLPSRIINYFTNRNLVPYADLFLGKGLYLFFNYRNWPLLRSTSTTYIHDIVHLLHPEYVEPKNKEMLMRMMPKWLKRSSAVVVVSESTKKELAEFFPQFSNKITVVPNGVDMQLYYRREPNEINSAKARYGIDGPFVMHLSNIEPRKNLLTVLKAVEDEPVFRSGLSLLLIGGMGWLNQEVMSQIENLKLNGVKIITPDTYVPDDDIPALLSGADALIQASLHEGFGISPLYAMACGTLPIISDIPAHREVGGNLAVYFNPSDSRRLGQLIKNRKKLRLGVSDAELSQRAQEFSWSQNVNILEKIFSEQYN